jgi:hypothetical protein
MADVVDSFLNGVNPSSTGTLYSTVLATEDRRDFSVLLVMPAPSGSGSDTLDIVIEESDQRDFADAERINAVTLTNPAGTTGTSFTQVLGSTTLPADTTTSTPLRQKFNLSDKNLNKFLRARYTIAGTATNFTDVTLLLLSNKKV